MLGAPGMGPHLAAGVEAGVQSALKAIPVPKGRAYNLKGPREDMVGDLLFYICTIKL